MDIRIKTWLVDIQIAIEEIFVFLGEKRDFHSYKQDLKLKKLLNEILRLLVKP